MGKKFSCWICGKEHEYCPDCNRTHAWKYVACCYEHYQIHLILDQYVTGVYSKEEAAKAFEDVTNVRAEEDLSWMKPGIEKTTREIIGEKEKPLKTTKKSKLYQE